jgi:Ca2+-transporting ATPase
MTVVEVKSNNPDFAIELSCMCTDCDILYKNGKLEVNGEPTEVALVQNGLKNNKNKTDLYHQMPRVGEIPFDSNRKMMTTIHKIGNKYRVITKGAPDVLLNKCNISSIQNQQIQKQNLIMAEKALRVIAVSYKDLDKLPSKIESDNIENNLNFVRINRND